MRHFYHVLSAGAFEERFGIGTPLLRDCALVKARCEYVALAMRHFEWMLPVCCESFNRIIGPIGIVDSVHFDFRHWGLPGVV